MGIVKQKKLYLSEHLEGRDGRVALDGGYLYIYLDGKLIHIAGIPSLYHLAERTSDSSVENTDDFVDDNGNNFEVVIYSSLAGIEWAMQTHPDDETIFQNLSYEVKLNEN